MTTGTAPIDEARRIPRNLLEPSPTNPRKHFDAARLAEMRESIQRHGVLQPLVVRAIAGRDGSDGRALYEIVSGERRWRASEGAQDALPCMVRELSDLEVLEIQVIENVQRDDLHPLEEADGYEQLLLDPPWWSAHHRPRVTGYTIDELAARVGKSKSHVYARLRLLGLTPTARHAFFEGQFGISSALQIARLNTMHQEELVQALVHDAEKGAAWSADTISHTVQRRYMLRLAGAPFSLHDAALLPEAGACTTCPKRSGANPELFDDITEADTCADRGCFARKCAAHEVAAITLAEERGHTVITGIEAARLLPTPDATIKGYLRLDRPSEFALSNKPLAEVLGSDARDVALIVRSHGDGVPSTMVEVMPTPIVRQVLRGKGLLRKDDKDDAEKSAAAPKPKKPKHPDAAAAAAAGETSAPAAETIDDPELAAALKDFTVLREFDVKRGKARVVPPPSTQRMRTEQAIAEARRIMLGHHIGQLLRTDAAEGFPSDGLNHIVARSLATFFMPKETQRFGLLVGIDSSKLADEAAIWRLAEQEAARLAIILLAVQEGFASRNEPDPAQHVAERLGVATAGIEQRAKDLVAERLRLELLAIAPQTATKKREKAPAKKPARAPCKYRDAHTGETWSGRGQQPKWLKVALSNGKHLADFELAPAAAKPKAEPPAAPTAPRPQLSPEAAWPFPPDTRDKSAGARKVTAVGLKQAHDIVVRDQRASISTLQRELRVGYNEAARLLEALEQQQIVGPMRADGSREVLVKTDGVKHESGATPGTGAAQIPEAEVPY